MRRFKKAIIVSSRKNELRYLVNLIPALSLLGAKVDVLLLQREFNPAKSHLLVDRGMASLLQELFPFANVKLVRVGDDPSVATKVAETNSVFISIDPPSAYSSRLSSTSLPWIQVQHSDDLFLSNGLSDRKADGFLLLGEKWISDRVRFDSVLSAFARQSIDYVRSRPVAFPGHLGLGGFTPDLGKLRFAELDPENTILLLDHSIALRARSPMLTLVKSSLLCMRYPLEIQGFRKILKMLRRKAREENLEIVVRPRVKGLPLPLGYPRGAQKTDVDLINDDPSYQMLASKGIISFFPSFGVLEALYLGRQVLGIDWWRLIGSQAWIHSSLQRVMWSELLRSSCPAFLLLDLFGDDLGLRKFFEESDGTGNFEIDGWISPQARRLEELDRLLFEVSEL